MTNLTATKHKNPPSQRIRRAGFMGGISALLGWGGFGGLEAGGAFG